MKISCINNLIKSLCASKRDVIKLQTLQYIFWNSFSLKFKFKKYLTQLWGRSQARISYVQYFSTNWMYVRHYKRPIILDTLLYHCLNKNNIACWWYFFKYILLHALKSTYSIPDAHDLSHDLLQVHQSYRSQVV